MSLQTKEVQIGDRLHTKRASLSERRTRARHYLCPHSQVLLRTQCFKFILLILIFRFKFLGCTLLSIK